MAIVVSNTSFNPADYPRVTIPRLCGAALLAHSPGRQGGGSPGFTPCKAVVTSRSRCTSRPTLPSQAAHVFIVRGTCLNNTLPLSSLFKDSTSFMAMYKCY